MIGTPTTHARATGSALSGAGTADARATGAAPPDAQSPAGGTATAADVRARVVAVLREVRRFARGIVGSDAYDTYLTHHRVTGCTHEPMSERQFWREKYAAQDRNPEGRCC